MEMDDITKIAMLEAVLEMAKMDLEAMRQTAVYFAYQPQEKKESKNPDRLIEFKFNEIRKKF